MEKVLIEMEMPKSCCKCKFHIAVTELYWECILTKKVVNPYVWETKKGRHPKCPLQEAKE